MRRGFAGLLLLLLMGACGGSERPRRIVLITLDTLRLDSFAGDAEREGEMPRMRAWASHGLVFERGYAATSTTQPTHASILTGMHPWEHGVARNGVVLHADLATVSEALSENGYETAAVVASFPLHRRFGFAQGFDDYYDVFQHGAATNWQGVDVAAGGFYSLAPEVNRRAFEMLDHMQGERQFLWVHYFDPHPPHGDSGELDSPPPLPKQERPLSVEQRAALARFLYDSDVRALDTALEVLRVRLERDADRFETHVVVTADHGESFGEDGAVGHGFRVSDEQIRVPLFIISPRVAPGVRNEPVGSIDVGATLIDLAGLGSRWGRGVSLIEPSRDGVRVLGMRRRYAPGALEPLADGSRRPLPEHRFYLVEGDRVIRGNSESVDWAAPSEDVERIRAEFAGFEQELVERNPQVLEDAEIQAGLEALGYTQ